MLSPPLNPPVYECFKEKVTLMQQDYKTGGDDSGKADRPVTCHTLPHDTGRPPEDNDKY